MIRHLTAFALALAAIVVPSVARAQVFSNSPFAQQQTPYIVCSITSTAPTACFGLQGPVRQLVAFVNNSSAAQNGVTVTCYDYILTPQSLLTAIQAAPVAATVAPLGATQIITWPAPGRPVINSLTCIASSAPNGVQIELYAR